MGYNLGVVHIWNLIGSGFSAFWRVCISTAHLHTKFQQIPTTCHWIIDEAIKFTTAFYRCQFCQV